VLNKSGSGTGTRPIREPEPKPKLSKVGTGTPLSHPLNPAPDLGPNSFLKVLTPEPHLLNADAFYLDWVSVVKSW
jgi:hypothetical protein